MNSSKFVDAAWMWKESSSSLRRLLPRIEARFKDQTDPAEWDSYSERLKHHFPRLFEHLYTLYGDDYDFFFHLEGILVLGDRDVAGAAGRTQGA